MIIVIQYCRLYSLNCILISRTYLTTSCKFAHFMLFQVWWLKCKKFSSFWERLSPCRKSHFPNATILEGSSITLLRDTTWSRIVESKQQWELRLWLRPQLSNFSWLQPLHIYQPRSQILQRRHSHWCSAFSEFPTLKKIRQN